jgi:hypothetical protein
MPALCALIAILLFKVKIRVIGRMTRIFCKSRQQEQMSEFRVGDLVCIDGETVRVTKAALRARLFDRSLFPCTRLATDEEKASYTQQMASKEEEFPSEAALKVVDKRCWVLNKIQEGFFPPPPILFKPIRSCMQSRRISELAPLESLEITDDDLPPLQSLETTEDFSVGFE